MPRSRKLRVAGRVVLASTGGVVAVVCLSSSLLAAIIGCLTIVAVLIDMMTHAHVEDDSVAPPTPQKITVDLSRRT
jgi:hypothetical protein